MSFDKPVLCPVLVGRRAYVESIERALRQASRGRGQTVLVAGEAGLGKSRLVAEARARAAQLGFSLLEGHCLDPDRSLPYAPLVDLLRTRFAGQPSEELARALGPAAPELSRLLPELATRLPGLPPAAPLEPEQEKHRLFHALAQLLTSLAAVQPLLVVEDVHWADEASLDFLLHLARRIRVQPILLLLTHRGDEPSASLGHFLAELDRARLAAELPLKPLSQPEVEAMLREIFELDRPVRAEFLEAIYGLTEGNPFFVEEVLGWLVARAVKAATYHEKPALSMGFYTYWEGVAVEGGETYGRDRRAVGAWPTDDGLVLTYVAWPIEEFPSFRADVEGNFLKTLGLAGDLGERVRGGKRAERFRGTPDLPNLFRKPHGPGWALVGDASLVMDPITGQGIGDALRDAELLADAIDAGFNGRQSLDAALPGYEQQRDREALPMYEFTTQLASFGPPRVEEQVLFASLAGKPTEIERFLGVLTGAIPVAEFFSPVNLIRILGPVGFARVAWARARRPPAEALKPSAA